MTVKCKPASLLGMLLIVSSSIKSNSAFQQCIHSCSGASSTHFQRRRKNKNTSCATIVASASSALQSSSYDEFDDFDDFDSFGEWDNRQQPYGDNPWDVVDWDNNRAAQFPPPPPPPPPYDRPPYSSSYSPSSNLRKQIASSTPSPYDNPSWTKSSRYGNRNVNFNSRSNRNDVNTFLRNDNAAGNNGNYYDPYQQTFDYGGRETYRNSAPKADYETNYQSSYKGYPSRTTYSQDDNYAGRRRWEDSTAERKKLYRDYDNVDNDPNSSRSQGSRRGGGTERRFNSNTYNNAVMTRPPGSQYRNYDDTNMAPNNRSYRQEDDGNRRRRSNGLPPPPQYRDYDDVNMEPNRSYRERDDDSFGGSAGGSSFGRFPPRPSTQYRDYDDFNSAPSQSYRSQSTNNNSNKFPPRPPPPPPQRPQSIPNNFASPQSNRSDSPPNNFPPGVGGMGYKPPSEYIPQNKRGGRARPSSFNSPPPPPPPPPPPQSSYPYNDNRKYQYDVNRREKYMDNDLINRGGQTQYNFPNGETIRKERINTLRPTGFNSIFFDMFRPFQQMFASAEQSLKSTDMLKEARLRILDNDVVTAKLGEPLQVSTPFSQSSSMSSVNGKKASKVRARFQVGGPYGTGVATMDSVDGEIRSLVVDINGSTVRVGPRQRGGGKKKKNVVEAEIIDE